MDLLGSYGSDDDAASGSDGEVPHAALAEPGRVTGVDAKPVEAQTTSILGSLPPPRKRHRRAVQIRIPITVAPDSSDEEDQPKKKVKTSTKGMKLSECLPPPQRADDGADVAGLLGAGYAKAAPSRGPDSDDEAAAANGFGDDIVIGDGNEAYRVFDEPGDVPGTGNGPENGAYDPDSYPLQGSGVAEAALGDQMLQQALQEEAAKATKSGQPLADPFAGVQFKEIKQDKLTYMPPAQKEARNATRTAFGADYEARTREEAGPQPGKVARRKHQIQSLYHQAKLKELEQMDLRGQASKTKRETQAKYGWS